MKIYIKEKGGLLLMLFFLPSGKGKSQTLQTSRVIPPSPVAQNRMRYGEIPAVEHPVYQGVNLLFQIPFPGGMKFLVQDRFLPSFHCMKTLR